MALKATSLRLLRDAHRALLKSAYAPKQTTDASLPHAPSFQALAYQDHHKATLDLLRLPPSTTNTPQLLTHDLIRLHRLHPKQSRSALVDRILRPAVMGKLARVTTSSEVVEALGLTGNLEERKYLENVRLALELRAHEAQAEGRLLDSTSRGLRFALGLLPERLSKKSIEELKVFAVTAAATSGTVPPQSEQQARIVRSPTSPGITRVIALAGCGKTTAIHQTAMQHHEKGLKCLYVCFNTATRKEASEKLGWASDTVSITALAKRVMERVVGKELLEKKAFWTDRETGRSVCRSLRAINIANLLKLRDLDHVDPMSGTTESISRKKQGWLIRQTLGTFVGSSDLFDTPNRCHLPVDSKPYPEDAILDLSRKLWSQCLDWKNVDAPLTTGMFVKAALQGGFRISEYGTYDTIFFDEVQDLSDAEISWFVKERNQSRIFLVGDPHQAIYRWRGGINTWLKLDVDLELHLTRSFRPGTDITNAANTLLALKGEDTSLQGTGRPASLYRPPSASHHDSSHIGGWTHLFFLNKDIIKKLLHLLPLLQRRSGSSRTLPRVSLRINSEKAGSPLCLYGHAYHLYHKLQAPDVYVHGKLRDFTSWEDLKRYVEDLQKEGIAEQEDRELLDAVSAEPMIKPVDFISRLDQARKVLNRRGGSDENRTVLGGVFQGMPPVFDQRYDQDSLWEDAVNLNYVAVTRAKDAVVLNNDLLSFFICDAGHASPCANCGTPSDKLIRYHTPFPHYPSHSASPSPSSSPSRAHSSFTSDQSTAPPPANADFDTFNFPCCLSCAKKSTYQPLVAYANELDEIEDALREVDKTATSTGPGVDFGEFEMTGYLVSGGESTHARAGAGQ
ncbi:P-loop containing nucleoside triphosphate hydrolase protein [Pseudohyphozyma bogoriensis]|nr:P-loop containing nucleoside triphosphate hydrolase protein [Pseudohyphozyma bogoriensis]